MIAGFWLVGRKCLVGERFLRQRTSPPNPKRNFVRGEDMVLKNERA